ncbi:hypothetical protein ACI6PS_02520 [Flavobacterium sp. PLA-1-15]|uniref:hypothetical protein n=1 Tax=Flavobacterium sp. PLA-1-15 TaxID=3380533 RepID=UPI003B7DA821
MLRNKYFQVPVEESADTEENSSELFISKYLSMHYQKIKSLPEDLVRLPTEEEIFFLQTESSFNAFTFIPLIAKHQGIKELYASTYSINIRVIEALVTLHDQGIVEQITLMISDSMIKRNPTTIDLISSLASTRPNINILFSWNHSKVCLMKTEFAHYVVEGSGNWSENALIEQYLFINSKHAYEFRKELFTHSKLRNK